LKKDGQDKEAMSTPGRLHDVLTLPTHRIGSVEGPKNT
jgi:hypothetical protein